MGGDLQDESFKKMQNVNKRIEDFLKEFNKDKGYAYILAHQPGTIYYKDNRYDITSDVLKGLNESYKKKE
jgi:outer membrane protein